MRFVYLNLEEQPRGNYMLDRLSAAGLIPLAVIEERSSLAEKGRINLTEELKKLVPEIPFPRTTAEIIAGHSIQHEFVANHNDAQCVALLSAIAPDLIVLGDTRIIQSHVIKIAPLGVVNVHPGYLPLVRGNNPYIWALLYDLPQGCSVHFVDDEIDTGPIIVRRLLELREGMTYPHLLSAINRLCGDLLIEALQRIAAGETGVPQADYPEARYALPTFRAASPQDKAKAVEKLSKGNQ